MSNETFLVLDIEATGPIASVHSMIEFAVVHLKVIDETFHPDRGTKTFTSFVEALKGWGSYATDNNFCRCHPHWVWDASTADWWHHPARIKNLDDIAEKAEDPYEVMRAFAKWLEIFKNPVIVCFGGDMEFLKYYWYKVIGTTPPFGLLPLEAKSYAMAVLNCDWLSTSNPRLRKIAPELFEDSLPHTHRALDDAKEQAVMFMRLRNRLQEQKYLQQKYENLYEAYDKNRKALEAHTRAVGEFLSEMHAIMIDPLAEGVTPVEEMCKLLKEAAIKERDYVHNMSGKIARIEGDLISGKLRYADQEDKVLVENKHNCIYEHKPESKKFLLGERWTCPTCKKQWERVYVERTDGVAVWAGIL